MSWASPSPAWAPDNPGVWCALEKIGNAAALATCVHDGVERARGHLRAAELLTVLDEAAAAVEAEPLPL